MEGKGERRWREGKRERERAHGSGGPTDTNFGGKHIQTCGFTKANDLTEYCISFIILLLLQYISFWAQHGRREREDGRKERRERERMRVGHRVRN